MGYLENISEKKVLELMKSKEFPYSSAPVLKDTVAVPSNGFTVVRILANNPGKLKTRGIAEYQLVN